MQVRRDDGSVIRCAVVGEPDAAPVLFCHGLADTRLSARMFAAEARELGLRLVAPDRPGIGGSEPRRLDRVADWVADAALVLDAVGAGSAAVLGISGGGPYAAACAALLPARVRRLALIAPLGDPGWPTLGMAAGERASLELARRAPAFSGWAMGRLAALARHSPGLFFRLSTSEMPGSDRRLLEEPAVRADFLANYIEAFRQGSGGVAQDLRLLTRPWGFALESIQVPVTVHHGDVDNTVPLRHSELYAERIPGAQLRVHPGEGHFSIIGRIRDMLAALAG
jgi:pimeloyl-ACP methyl ester carboxylesterase